MFKKFCKRRGFTLVETLIALALLGMIMLFVTRTIAMLSEASEDTDAMILDAADNVAVTAQIQEVFMRGNAVRADDGVNRVVIVTPDKEIGISIENNVLMIDSKIVAPLLRGSLHKEGDSVSFDLVLTNKSFIQITFYINEGGSYEKTSLE